MCSVLQTPSPLCLDAGFLCDSCKYRHQQWPKHTPTHTHEHALDDAVACFTLLASCQGDTPPERAGKQTAHNIIGIGPTCGRCMTCPVSLETSLHPITVSCTGLLSKWMEAWDWSDAIRRCYFLVMFAD